MMDACLEAWLQRPLDQLHECETLLCSQLPEAQQQLRDNRKFAAYLSALTAGKATGPCTSVWTAGSIAYRCKTCQTSPSSAICMTCFKAGGHENHDYVLYKSPAGGCCDCGDLSSWRLEGCCALHRPTASSGAASDIDSCDMELSQEHTRLLTAVLSTVILRLSMCYQDSLTDISLVGLSPTALLASQLLEWFRPLVSLAPVRTFCREVCIRSLHDWVGGDKSAIQNIDTAASTAVYTNPYRSMAMEVDADTASSSRADMHAAGRQWSNAAEDTVAAARSTAATSVMDAAAQLEGVSRQLALRLLMRSPNEAPDGETSSPYCLMHMLLHWMCSSVKPADITTFVLLLLYEPSIKRVCAEKVTNSYQRILLQMAFSGDPEPPLLACYDRLTVQLFNDAAMTMWLVRDKDLLAELLLTLDQLLRLAPHYLSGGFELAAQRIAFPVVFSCINRVLNDLTTCTHHPPVAAHAATHPDAVLIPFVKAGARLQWSMPEVRQLVGDPPPRHPGVSHMVTLEVTMAVHLAEILAAFRCTAAGKASSMSDSCAEPAACSRHAATTMNSSQGNDGRAIILSTTKATQLDTDHLDSDAVLPAPPEAVKDQQAMSSAAESSLLHALRYLVDDYHQQDYGCAVPTDGGTPYCPRECATQEALWCGLLNGQAQVSVHLPYQRFVAKIAQVLCMQEASQLAAPPFKVRDADQVPTSRDGNPEAIPLQGPCHGVLAQLLHSEGGADQSSAHPWRSLCRAVLLGTALWAQVDARMWLRNGETLQMLEYSFSTWKEYLLDMDIMMTQLWLSAEAPREALFHMIGINGGGPLLLAAGIGTAQGLASPVSIHPVSDELRLACTESALRNLLVTLRDRSAGCLPPRQRLRNELLQWLCVKPWGYQQLSELLPTELFNQGEKLGMSEVLAELADFTPPSFSARGTYRLKKHFWAEFEPHYAHYSSTVRYKVWEHAMEVEQLKPHCQLLPPRHPLPPSLQPMNRCLVSPELFQLIAFVLCCRGQSASTSVSLSSVAAAAVAAAAIAPAAAVAGQGGGARRVLGLAGAALPAAAGTSTGAAAATQGLATVTHNVLPALTEGILLAVLNLLALSLHHVDNLLRDATTVDAASAGTSAAIQTTNAALLGTCAKDMCVWGGILPLLQALSAPLSTCGTAAASHLPPAVSEEVADCITYLITTSTALLSNIKAHQVADEDIVSMDHARVADSDAAGAGGYNAASIIVPPAADAGAADSAAAELRKTVAKARQAEMMARMQAQQAAFQAVHASSSASHLMGSHHNSEPNSESEPDDCMLDEHRRTTGGIALHAGPETDTRAVAAGDGVAAEPLIVLNTDDDHVSPALHKGMLPQAVTKSSASMSNWHCMDGDCIICRRRGKDSNPLCWLASLSVCSCMSVPLEDNRRQWHQLEDLHPDNKSKVMDAEAAFYQRFCHHGLVAGDLDHRPGLHMLSCGHQMHVQCFMQHREGLKAAEASGIPVAGSELLDVARGEMLCPVCRRPATCLLPAAHFEWQPALCHDSADRNVGHAEQLAHRACNSTTCSYLLAACNTLLESWQRPATDTAAECTKLALGSFTPVVPSLTKQVHEHVCQHLEGIDFASGTRAQYLLDLSSAVLKRWREVTNADADDAAGALQNTSRSFQQRLERFLQQFPLTALAAEVAIGEDMAVPAVIDANEAVAAVDVAMLDRGSSGEVLAAAAMDEDLGPLSAAGPSVAIAPSVEPVIGGTVGHARAMQPQDDAALDALHGTDAVQGHPGLQMLVGAALVMENDAAVSIYEPVVLHLQHQQASGASAATLQPPALVRHSVSSDIPMLPPAVVSGDPHAAPCLCPVTTVCKGELQSATPGGASSLWAVLAHNLAHWEVNHRGGGASRVASMSPSSAHTTIRDARHPAGNNASAALQQGLQHADPSQAGPGSSEGAVSALAGKHNTALPGRPHTTPADELGSAVSPVLKAAHWRAMAGLSALCCAVGTAEGGSELKSGATAPAQSSSWSAGLAWLLGRSAGSTKDVCGDNKGECRLGRVPINLSNAHLARYDARVMETNLLQFLATATSGSQPTPPSFSYHDVSSWQGLVSDPFLLTLALFAGGLTSNVGLDWSGLQHTSGVEDGAEKPTASWPPAVLLLHNVLAVTYPIMATQAGLWAQNFGSNVSLASWGGSHQLGYGTSPTNTLLQPLYCQLLQHSPLEVICAQLLPQLLRVYALHCLLLQQEPDDDLMHCYRQLPTVATHPANSVTLPAQPSGSSSACHADNATSSSTPPSPVSTLLHRVLAALGLPPLEHALCVARELSDQDNAVGLEQLLSRWCSVHRWALQHSATLALSQDTAVDQGSPAARASTSNALIWMACSSRDGEDVQSVVEMNGRSHHAVPGCRQAYIARLPFFPSLIPLPLLFQDLFVRYMAWRCPVCGEHSSEVSICLITARPVCSWTHGCRRTAGGCPLHAIEHCGGTTVLLTLRRIMTVVVRGARTAICRSLYLDAHGEEDPDMRRGRPLYLDQKCYGEISRLWATAAFDFDSYVLNQSRRVMDMPPPMLLL